LNSDYQTYLGTLLFMLPLSGSLPIESRKSGMLQTRLINQATTNYNLPNKLGSYEKEL